MWTRIWESDRGTAKARFEISTGLKPKAIGAAALPRTGFVSNRIPNVNTNTFKRNRHLVPNGSLNKIGGVQSSRRSPPFNRKVCPEGHLPCLQAIRRLSSCLPEFLWLCQVCLPIFSCIDTMCRMLVACDALAWLTIIPAEFFFFSATLTHPPENDQILQPVVNPNLQLSPCQSWLSDSQIWI